MFEMVLWDVWDSQMCLDNMVSTVHELTARKYNKAWLETKWRSSIVAKTPKQIEAFLTYPFVSGRDPWYYFIGWSHRHQQVGVVINLNRDNPAARVWLRCPACLYNSKNTWKQTHCVWNPIGLFESHWPFWILPAKKSQDWIRFGEWVFASKHEETLTGMVYIVPSLKLT